MDENKTNHRYVTRILGGSQSGLIPVLAIVVVVVTGLSYCLINISIGRGPAQERFFTVPPAEVSSISLKPGRLPGGPIQAEIELTEQARIETFLTALRRSEKFSPNHPVTEWETPIQIKTKTGVSFGTFRRTNQGLLLYVGSEPNGGWNFGTFLCKDEFREMITEDVLATQN